MTSLNNQNTLKKAVKILGTNLMDTALLLGISESYMYKLHSGNRKVSDKLIIKLGKAVIEKISEKQ